METTFKSIEFVRRREDCKTVINTFHQKGKSAVVKKNYKLYQSVLQTVVIGYLPDLLLRGNEIKRKGVSGPEDQLFLEYFELYEEIFSLVVHQSWLAYMNQKYEKGDTILFKFLMLFLTENFYESWKASEPRSAIKTMVRNSILS